MASTISLVTSVGALLPGMAAVVMATSVVAIALAPVERFILRFRVAAGVLRLACLERKLDESCPKALNLLFDRRPNVVGLDARAKAACGRDGLQPGDAGADDENARGGHRSCRGIEHGKHSRQCVGRKKNCFVPCDRRHRRERIHALRSRDSRNELHGEERGAAVGDLLRRTGGRQRFCESDDDLATMKKREVCGSWTWIRTNGPDLGHDVRGKRVGTRSDADLFGRIGGVGKARGFAGRLFDDEVDAKLAESGNDSWNDRDAPLTRECFSRDAEFHRR